MKAAILGSTGYAGMVLMRILADHPDVSEVLAVSSSQPGESIAASDPGIGASLAGKTTASNGTFIDVAAAAARRPDVVFSALPHLTSAKVCEPFFGSTVVIDLSADFRIHRADLFHRAYGEEPARPDLLPQAVYGLCEIYREEVEHADIIASPGCYPTSALLPLIPLVRAKALQGKIFINSMSGISGAGRKTQPSYLFVERHENCGAYNPGTTHRHYAEIFEKLADNDPKVAVYFTPHLVPMSRGIATTISAQLAQNMSAETIGEIFTRAYGNTPFARPQGSRIPATKDVLGSNRCDIGWHVDGDTLFVFSVLDNLVKGAGGQAVQSMNIRFGLEETAGLRQHGEV